MPTIVSRLSILFSVLIFSNIGFADASFDLLVEKIRGEQWGEATQILQSEDNLNLKSLIGEHNSSILWIALHPKEGQSNELSPDFESLSEEQEELVRVLIEKDPELVNLISGRYQLPLVSYLLLTYHNLSETDLIRAKAYQNKVEWFMEAFKPDLMTRAKIGNFILPVPLQLAQAGASFGLRFLIETGRINPVTVYSARVENGEVSESQASIFPEIIRNSYISGSEQYDPILQFLDYFIAEHGFDFSTALNDQVEQTDNFLLDMILLLIGLGDDRNSLDSYHRVRSRFGEVLDIFVKNGLRVDEVIRQSPKTDLLEASIRMFFHAGDPWLFDFLFQPRRQAISDSQVTGMQIRPLVAFEDDGLRTAMTEAAFRLANRTALNQVVGPITAQSQLSTTFNWEFISPEAMSDRTLRRPRPIHLAVESIIYNNGDSEKTLAWIREVVARGADPRLTDAATGSSLMEEPRLLLERVRTGEFRKTIRTQGLDLDKIIDGLNTLRLAMNAQGFLTDLQKVHHTQLGTPFDAEENMKPGSCAEAILRSNL